MKKILKWLLGTVAFLAVLVVLAIILLPLVFDPNEHKPRIQQLAAEGIGREVVLNGPIEWSVFPWVAINLTDVKVANEAGFKGDYLATVDQVAVRVKLLPLLSKQIQIGQVELKQPTINLQVAQSGQSNWQSILTTLAADAGSESTDSSSTDLEIRGIHISEGTLAYVDSGADMRVEMTDLLFTSEAIKTDAPTAMSISAQLKLPEQALNGELRAAWHANNLTNGLGMLLDFDELRFDGMSDEIPLKLSIDNKAAVDLGQDTLQMDSLKLSYDVMEVSTSVAGKNLSNNMLLSGELAVDAFSLDELLAAMGSPLNNQAENQMSGSLAWSLVNDRLQLKNILFKLDGSELQGHFDFRQLSQLKGQFDMNINQINLDEYLPAAENNTSASPSTSSTAMDLGQMTGQIKMSQLQAAGVKMDDITLSIKTRGQDITVEPLQAGFYQGLIKTELQLQPGKASEKLTVSHRMQDFQAGSLLTDLMGSDYITGLGQLNANIKIDQPFSEHPLQSANGTLSYQLTDGDIVGIDVFQIMQQSLSLLNKNDALQSNSELKTSFGLMDIQAEINNGVLKTNTLNLTSPYFDLKGQVEINLDQQTIKGTIKPMLTNIPEGVLDKNFEKLINLRIPVSLTGSLLEPAVKIDIQKLILESQKAKIDEKKEELKEDLFDALLGSKKDKNQTGSDSDQVEGAPEMTEEEKKRAEKDQLKRDLLEGLFKKSKDKKKDDTEDGEGNE